MYKERETKTKLDEKKKMEVKRKKTGKKIIARDI